MFSLPVGVFTDTRLLQESPKRAPFRFSKLRNSPLSCLVCWQIPSTVFLSFEGCSVVGPLPLLPSTLSFRLTVLLCLVLTSSSVVASLESLLDKLLVLLPSLASFLRLMDSSLQLYLLKAIKNDPNDKNNGYNSLNCFQNSILSYEKNLFSCDKFT